MAAITVCVPVYNGEKLLAECLESLAAQTFGDFEVVVRDNASTDATGQIAAAFAARDGRFRHVRMDENVGMLGNFHGGLEEASSEFFLWRAYDDLCNPSYLEALHGALLADPHANLAAPTVRSVKMASGKTRVLPAPKLTGSGAMRAAKCLRQVKPGWFYGLYRRAPLVEATRFAAEHFPHVWGWDFATLLPFLIRGEVAGAPGAEFTQRVFPTQGYQSPLTPQSRAAIWSDYTVAAREILDEAAYGPAAKALLSAAIVGHTNRRLVRLSALLKDRLG